MRKLTLSVLMMTLLLLSGCGEREAALERGFSSFREAVTHAESITAETELTVSSGAAAAEYTLRLSYDGRAAEIEILKPELIAGIKAVAENGEGEIVYEGVRLGTGPIDADGLTPVSALPAILKAMQSGYLELLWWEEPYIAARLHIGETSVLTLWLERETLVPVTAEIASGGLTVLSCRFLSWEMQ